MGMLRASPLARTFGLLVHAHRALTISWILVVLAQAVLFPFTAYTGKEIADAIIAGSTPDIVRWVLVELLLASATVALTRLAMDARMLLRGRVRLEARLRITEKAGELELARLEEPEVRDRLAAARAAADLRPLVLVHETLVTIRSALSLLVYAVLLSTFSPWALLFLLAIIPGAAAELWRAGKGVRGHQARMRDTRRLRYLQDTIFSERLAAENRLYGVSPVLVEQSHELGRALLAEERADWRRSLPVSFACQLLPTLMVNGTYLLMAVATVRGELTVGELTLYGMSLTDAQRLCQTLLLSGRSALEGWPHLHTLFAFLDLPPRAAPARDAEAPAKVHVETAPGSTTALRLENVGFRYPGADAWAIRNIDLEIAPGDFIAVVGGNGDGKTTLFKLITGLVRPTEGRITLDGRDLASWDPTELKRRFAVVFQGFERYGLTLKDNVAIGRGHVDADAGSLASALRASRADAVAAELPRGLDTELIPSLPDGAGLSGGQWQRIALARGFVREDADYLLLDEPTSALDAATEQHVVEHLRSRQGPKAIVLITHRSSLLRPTDKIVRLERGRLIRGEREADVAAGHRHLAVGRGDRDTEHVA